MGYLNGGKRSVKLGDTDEFILVHCTSVLEWLLLRYTKCMGYLDGGKRPGQLGDTGQIVLGHCSPLAKVINLHDTYTLKIVSYSLEKTVLWYLSICCFM